MPTLLVLTVLLPLIGAVALFLMPRLDYRVARQVGLVFVLATLALSLVFANTFDRSDTLPQFAFESPRPDGTLGYVHGLPWITFANGPGVRFALGLDGVGLTLFVLTSVLMVPSVFASWESVTERASAHYALMLALQTGLLGLFASLDVVLFYIFFEFTLIPLFFLIGLYGGPERRRASIYFFLYTLAGSLLTLIGVILLVVVHWRFSDDHALTFSIPELTSGLAALPWPAWSAESTTTWLSPQALIFLLLFAGFAVKVPLFPFHTWLPLAHVQAPTAGSILLAGVLLKVGGYGLYRFNVAMTPHGTDYWFPLVAALSVVGIIYGALTSLAQTDFKRLVAYSSVSHMGFIVLGLMTRNATGIDGAIIQMVNHGITTGALFACVGVFYERYHTREMAEIGGLWERMPLLAFFFILSALGSAAVPGLNGFVGEFPILLGAFERHPMTAVLAATGMILGAYYLMHLLQKALFGPLREPGHHASHDDHGGGHHETTSTEAAAAVRPVGWHEIAGLAPLMALIVLIGVYPMPITSRIAPATRQVIQFIPPPPVETALAPTGPAAALARTVPVEDRPR